MNQHNQDTPMQPMPPTKPEPIPEVKTVATAEPTAPKPQSTTPPPTLKTEPTPPPPVPKVTPPPTATEKPKPKEQPTQKTGYAALLESHGIGKWRKVQALKHTPEAYDLLQKYGGTEAFLKLYHECKADVATLENGIQANEERIKSYTDLRKAIVTYNRTKPIYEQYQNTKFSKSGSVINTRATS